MYINYYPVGNQSPVRRAIGLNQIAAYIGTEWLPNIPISAINGLADVVRSFLVTEQQNQWGVHPDLDNTDRQWKGATSWMLGVAFARYVIEDEGYPWWAPVSGFTGSTNTGSWPMTSGSTVQPPVRSLLRVEDDTSSRSRLLPDYLTCRPGRGSAFEFAFFEAKGNKRALQNLHSPPSEWQQQAKNARLFFLDYEVAIGRYAVVATRINPEAPKPKTREISVRAWNRYSEHNQYDPNLFGHFAANHYTGMCRRLGFTELARQLEQHALRQVTVQSRSRSSSVQNIRDQVRQVWSSPISDLLGSDVALYMPINGMPRLSVGNRSFQVGLTAPAVRLINALLSSEWGNLLQAQVPQFQEEVEQMRAQVNDRQTDRYSYILRNGIAFVEQG